MTRGPTPLGLCAFVLFAGALATRLPAGAVTPPEAPIGAGAVSGSYSAQNPQGCQLYGGQTGFSVGPMTIATTIPGSQPIPVVITVPVLTGTGGGCGGASTYYYGAFNSLMLPVSGTDAAGETVSGTCGGGTLPGDFSLSYLDASAVPVDNPPDLIGVPLTEVTISLGCLLQIGSGPVTNPQLTVTAAAVPGGWTSGFTGTVQTTPGP